MKSFRSNSKSLMIMLVDAVLINLAYVTAFYFRFGGEWGLGSFEVYKKNAIFITLIYLVFLYFFRLYENLWYYATTDEFLHTICGCILAGVSCVILGILGKYRLPYSIDLLAGIFSVLFVIGFRIIYRGYRKYIRNSQYKNKFIKDGCKRVMIVGAGTAGAMIINEMKQHKDIRQIPVAVIDDDDNKLGKSINGVKIRGNSSRIVEIAAVMKIELIVIAIPSLDKKRKKELIDICKKTNAKLQILPGIYELLDNKVTLNHIRDISYEELLGRDQVKLDTKGIENFLRGKKVMITGGGGSIGSEICRQIARFSPSEVILLDNYENGIYELQQEFKYSGVEINLSCVIASIRDRKRLEGVFREYKPEIIFHAAAHKHVPLMEDNPEESIKNNVFGTLNLAECADKYNVERFVMISTDKAVNPTNIMGATKRLCEMIIQSIDKKSNTQFVAVRFGNVLGSNGSVVPLFKKQIANGGPVTITHPEINRFFMTIPEAAQLVIQASVFAEGGEIFVLDMDEPIRIYDMACDLIRLSGFEPHEDIKLEFIGLRPGEKLYEEVLTEEEGLNKTVHEKIFVGRPTFSNFELLKKNLEELMFITEGGNREEIIRKLKELVPTYKKAVYEDEIVVASK